MVVTDNNIFSVNTARAANCLSDWLTNHESKKDIKSPFHLAFGAPLMDYHNTVRHGLDSIIYLLMKFLIKPEGKKTVPVCIIRSSSLRRWLIPCVICQTFQLFMKGVASWGEMTGKVESLKAFPWAQHFSVSDRVTVCDVGAGDGHAMLTVMKLYESYNFRAVIQDRPAFIELSKQVDSVFY